jgi:hypothetical protein
VCLCVCVCVVFIGAVIAKAMTPHPSAEENDGVCVRGDQCVYSSGAHCIRRRICVCVRLSVCARALTSERL